MHLEKCRRQQCSRWINKLNLPFLVQRHSLVVVWNAMFSLALVQDSFATDACVQSIAMMLDRPCSMVLRPNQVPDINFSVIENDYNTLMSAMFALRMSCAMDAKWFQKYTSHLKRFNEKVAFDHDAVDRFVRCHSSECKITAITHLEFR